MAIDPADEGGEAPCLAHRLDEDGELVDTHRLGYQRVDGDPNVGVLIANMDETSRWPATIELRAWERERLALQPAERLLDVGCGTGDAGLALAVDLGPDGELVGLDLSESMLDTARARASTARCRSRFSLGDAMALDEPDASFDAARSERTLQWVTDPSVAVSELVRVLRPGGRLCLTDTDWSTLRLHVGDVALEAAVIAGLADERARPSNVGRRLGDLLRSAGCTDVVATSSTNVWTGWDPDDEPAPLGCFSMSSLAEDLVDRGHLDPGEAEQFASTVEAAARAGRFTMELTVHSVVARR